MKKTLLALTTFAAVSLPAQALVYVQADLGYAETKFHSVQKDNFVARPTLGLSWDGDSHLGLDYSKWGDKTYLGHEAKFQTYGLKYTYRLNLPVLKPYVGARLNMTNVDWLGMSSKNHFGYGAMAGVEFKPLPFISFGVGGEWNKLTPDTENLFFSTFARFDF